MKTLWTMFHYPSRPAFHSRNRAGGGLVDEKAHFRMAWLEIGFDAVVFQSLGGGGSDGSHEDRTESFDYLRFNTLPRRDLQKIDALHRGGEEHDIEVSGDQPRSGLAKRSGIFGKIPAIDANGRHLLAQCL